MKERVFLLDFFVMAADVRTGGSAEIMSLREEVMFNYLHGQQFNP